MSLPAPNLDDRRFQDLVDDAKRRIQVECPSWTDHNVSDPGITLVEVFAWMTDQLLHRMNQVPDRMYVKFLELLGVRLEPPAAARAPITFWLSKPQPDPVYVRVGTEVATVRTETDPAIPFSVTEDLAIVPCELSQVLSANSSGEAPRSLTEPLRYNESVECFSEPPRPGDVLLIGLSAPVPSCAITLRFVCTEAEGRGIDPRNPPLRWEAADPAAPGGWSRCDLERDLTGGLNRPGDVVLHVPGSVGARATWLRCKIVEAKGKQRPYVESPTIQALSAFTVGGTTSAVNAAVYENEELGTSNGAAGQRFRLVNRPVVIDTTDPEHDLVVQVSTTDGWADWERVDSFADSGPADHHFVVEEIDGVVVFGPAVREPDGSLSRYGTTPQAGATIRVRSYRSGGGLQGNVAAGAIKMAKSSIPLIGKVENRLRAEGGREAESLESAKIRGPMQLRGTRAVAAGDYEYQALKAAPDEIARVKCLAAGPDGADAGSVRLLLVPAVPDDESGHPPFTELTVLNERLVRCVQDHIDARRTIGARVAIEPPLYEGIAVSAVIHAGPRANALRLEADAVRALYRYFHPITGGPDGNGWPFGRPVLKGEVFSVLQRLPGIALVEDVQLHEANPTTSRQGDPTDRIDLRPDALVFSHLHEVSVANEGTPGEQSR